MVKKITIIGLGEIGSNTLSEMVRISNNKKLDNKFFGVDINEKLLIEMQNRFPYVGFLKEIPYSDIYIISVYTTEQVDNVFSKIDFSNKPLIVVESTIFPETAKKLKSRWERDKNFNLVLFPHRFNPNDPKHFVFNLNRIISGVNEESIDVALNYYLDFMEKNLITIVPYEISAISKIAENAYRFIEIAIAEDWKKECEKIGIDFNELRRAMNTKWNIELKEAREGIGGKCLPKDANLLNEYFRGNKILKEAIKVNDEYKKDFDKSNVYEVVSAVQKKIHE